jgi:hypothetical protein
MTSDSTAASDHPSTFFRSPPTNFARPAAGGSKP